MEAELTDELALVVQEDEAVITVFSQVEDYSQTVANVTGQIAPSSGRVYRSDAKAFACWLQERGYIDLSREAVIAYHQHLRSYHPNTAARKWSVVRRIVEEHVIRHQLLFNPAQGIKGFQQRESPKHIALSDKEARKLLGSVDRTKKKGLRDYAMLRLLIRLALRRSECAKLVVGDMGMRQGHHLLLIRQSKEEKDRLLKLPVAVWRSLIDYLEAIGNVVVPHEPDGTACYEALTWNVKESHPLFVGFDKGDHPTHQGISDDVVYHVVKYYGAKARIEKITAHSMRATGITLMLEAGASLDGVQDVAGHADPRTTRKYDRRKLNLDSNPVDKVDI